MDRNLNIELTHHYVNVGEVRLHYVTGGQGPAMVFLHGWPQTWYMWRDVLPGMMQHYRVVALDMRGLGDSSRPNSGYDTKTVAQDVWHLMHDVLGEESFYVVAHDWGGPVAYALAAQHRDAVRAMAVLDAPVIGDGSALNGIPRWHFGFHGEPDLPESLVAGREDVYLRHMYRKGGARPDAISEEAQREYVRAYSQPGAMRAGFNYYRAMPQDARDHQAFVRQGGKLQMPILVYGGGAPNVGRGYFAMDSWQRMCDDVTGGIAPDCGHWIAEERPAWVVEKLTEFFGRLDSEASARRAKKANPPLNPTRQEGTAMFYEKIDTALIDVEALPWVPFTPYSDQILLKIMKVDPISGQWITLLKVPPNSELPLHHHAGTVMVSTLKGSWRYLEHDWVATPGSFVYETAGSRHTPVSVGDEEVITLNIVQGDWNLLSPEGAVLAIENWKSMMDRYLSYCRTNNIEPIDISSFSV
ncbi:alpha/beta hydrolase [Caballeronia calidae]|uniref:Alpha/beta hydrolase n=1 Tax=Caballeronia calidae TaxID=1777139 RepID=A0A158E8S2_9BURK|nr:alpha/beta hydrolase [Caballeronia calidae]